MVALSMAVGEAAIGSDSRIGVESGRKITAPMTNIAMAAVGFTLWFYIPALLPIPMDMYPNDPQRVSLIFAALIAMTGITGAIAPPAVGAIADLTGSLIPGLAACAVLTWALPIAGVLLRPAHPVCSQPPLGLSRRHRRWLSRSIQQRLHNNL